MSINSIKSRQIALIHTFRSKNGVFELEIFKWITKFACANARLIDSNLPFSAVEEILKEKFQLKFFIFSICVSLKFSEKCSHQEEKKIWTSRTSSIIYTISDSIPYPLKGRAVRQIEYFSEMELFWQVKTKRSLLCRSVDFPSLSLVCRRAANNSNKKKKKSIRCNKNFMLTRRSSTHSCKHTHNFFFGWENEIER